MVMISIASPGVYFGDIEFTRRLARECNEAMARMVANHPGRFGAMAFVPLPDIDASIREVAYALDELKLDGINLLSHTGERYLGHSDEAALYAELCQRSYSIRHQPLAARLVDGRCTAVRDCDFESSLS